MSYSTELARFIGKQLSRFATSNRVELAGTVANVEFWLDEVNHALGVIDGYRRRFDRLYEAQTRYAAEHDTIEFCLDDPSCRDKFAPPRKVPSEELIEARRYLCNSTYRFLVRCCNESMISEADLRAACARFDIGVESRDLKIRV